MTSADQYRMIAAALRARAQANDNPDIQKQLDALARNYLLLAEQADKNSHCDVVYEPPPVKAADSQP